MAYTADYSDSRACERAVERYLCGKYLDVILAPDDVALPWDLKVPSQDLVFEVKLDRYAGVKSQNVAVEVACRNKPSGLTITEAGWWIFFVQGQALAIEVDDLRELIKGRKTVMGGDDKAAEMVLLPLSELRRHAYRIPLDAPRVAA